jgi:hypothetical protein
VKQEAIIKPSNPLTAKARSVISLHDNHKRFPEGDTDKVRYLDNERVMRKDAEHWLLRIKSIDLPVLVRDGTAREVLLNAFVTGNRVVTGASNVDVFSRSIFCNSVSDDLFSEAINLFPPWSGDCNSGGHRICSLDKSKSTFDGIYDSTIKMIPSCIANLVNLELLKLSYTGVSKIEGLESNVNLEELALSSSAVSKIEGLENNGKLKFLDLSNTNVGKIDCDEFREARPLVSLYY